MIKKGERLRTQRTLLDYIGHKLEPWGFNPKPSGQSFYQKNAGSTWAFHISFIPHREDFDLTADVAVRIDALEDLVNQYDSKRNAAEKRKSMTIGAELGKISQRGTRSAGLFLIQKISQSWVTRWSRRLKGSVFRSCMPTRT